MQSYQIEQIPNHLIKYLLNRITLQAWDRLNESSSSQLELIRQGSQRVAPRVHKGFYWTHQNQSISLDSGYRPHGLINCRHLMRRQQIPKRSQVVVQYSIRRFAFCHYFSPSVSSFILSTTDARGLLGVPLESSPSEPECLTKLLVYPYWSLHLKPTPVSPVKGLALIDAKLQTVGNPMRGVWEISGLICDLYVDAANNFLGYVLKSEMDTVISDGCKHGIFKLFKSWIKISSKYSHTWIFSPKTKTSASYMDEWACQIAPMCI